MEKKFKQQLEKAKHLQLARKKEVYSNDYQMVTFTAHLEEMSEIRTKLIAEIDNYTEGGRKVNNRYQTMYRYYPKEAEGAKPRTRVNR